MVPLEQYNRQLYSLWDKLYDSIESQVEDGLWFDLDTKLREELGEETLIYTLKEELRSICYP